MWPGLGLGTWDGPGSQGAVLKSGRLQGHVHLGLPVPGQLGWRHPLQAVALSCVLQASVMGIHGRGSQWAPFWQLPHFLAFCCPHFQTGWLHVLGSLRRVWTHWLVP